MSRSRQIWFLIFNFLKYIKGESQFGDEDITFQGPHEIEHHRYNPYAADRRKILKTIPKHLQCSTLITRGRFLDFILKEGGTFAMAFMSTGALDGAKLQYNRGTRRCVVQDKLYFTNEYDSII